MPHRVRDTEGGLLAILPGQEFVDGQGVAAAGFLKGEQAAANRGNDFGLAADHPPFGPGCGQIRNR
jgi:hypothetical protein